MTTHAAERIEQQPGPVLRIIVTPRGIERVETVGSLLDQFEALRLGQVVLPCLALIHAVVGRYKPLKPRRERRPRKVPSPSTAGAAEAR